jgi:RNA recognition motif-containing protein
MVIHLAPISGQSSIPRGPPRKPKQSGHTLWVGNLPPGTTVIDLKDHFSRDATKDILSVFLISKSNCAFVNYKTADSCADAMNRFHDSRFQGVRLVCRLRRSSVIAIPDVPTGPAALSSSGPAVVRTPGVEETETRDAKKHVDYKEKSIASTRVRDKYFVVKSLTVEDLEISVRNGVWATQSHNEATLNNAYKVRFNPLQLKTFLIGIDRGCRILDIFRK